jgi:alpha-ketoglutarate-dependent 2,4-dichlorophenoxyacetate dioxygenase
VRRPPGGFIVPWKGGGDRPWQQEATDMTLDIRPIDPARPDFVGEAHGDYDLRQADAAMVKAIEAAMDTYAVMVFHGQPFTDDQQLAFGQKFGRLEVSRSSVNPDRKLRFDNRLSDISNLDHDGRVLAAENRKFMSSLASRMWHSDSSYKPVTAKYSMLNARVVPSWGGQTEFADMRAAYDALSPRTQARVEDLVALHSQKFSREKLGFSDFSASELELNKPQPQPIVRTHPGSGRKTLFLAAHAGEVRGMTVPEGRMLLLDLIEHATQREFTYRHEWTVGDLVIWDNRCVMHRGRDYDREEVRDMRRVTVGNDVVTPEQQHAIDEQRRHEEARLRQAG